MAILADEPIVVKNPKVVETKNSENLHGGSNNSLDSGIGTSASGNGVQSDSGESIFFSSESDFEISGTNASGNDTEQNESQKITSSSSDNDNDDEEEEDKKKLIKFKAEDPLELEKLFGDQRCHCGTHLLREMRGWQLGDDWHFRVWPKPLGVGTTAAAYHAHAMSTLVGVDGKNVTLSQCVALKSVYFSEEIETIENELRNELDILKKFAELRAKRVIRLHAFKEIPEKKRLFYVLELGSNDLQKEVDNLYFYNWRPWNISSWLLMTTIEAEEVKEFEQEVEQKLTNVLEAVREMHKLVIHLDLKPENMLYVNVPTGGKEGNETMKVLKVIDFGGSEFIPPARKNQEWHKRANVCRLRQTGWGTRLYASPEQRCRVDPEYRIYEVTTKSDIWSVGMMLLEMLYTPFSLTRQDLNDLLFWIKDYFNPNEHEELPEEANNALLLVHRHFPRFFEIAMAALSAKPKKRPSAHGLLTFLKGKCRLAMPKFAVEFLKNNGITAPAEISAQNVEGQNVVLPPPCDRHTNEIDSQEEAEGK